MSSSSKEFSFLGCVSSAMNGMCALTKSIETIVVEKIAINIDKKNFLELILIFSSLWSLFYIDCFAIFNDI